MSWLTDCICSHDSCRVWQPWCCMNGHDGAKSTHVLGPGKLCRCVWAHIPSTHATAIFGVGASDLSSGCACYHHFICKTEHQWQWWMSLCKLLRIWRQRGLWRDLTMMGRRHQCLISSQFQVWYSYVTWEVYAARYINILPTCLYITWMTHHWESLMLDSYWLESIKRDLKTVTSWERNLYIDVLSSSPEDKKSVINRQHPLRHLEYQSTCRAINVVHFWWIVCPVTSIDL